SLRKITDVTASGCHANFAAMIGTDDAFHVDADLSPANFVNGVLVGGFTVLDGVTVTLRAGSVVKFGAPASFDGVRVAGTPNLLRSDVAPVVFTSLHDDAYGGDTDQDGGANPPARGDWGTFSVGDLLAAHETLVAEHVRFRYGGGTTLQAFVDL